MKKLSVILSILVLSLLMIGCSSSVSYQVRRAPQLNLIGIKTLRVSPFQISGHSPQQPASAQKGPKGVFGKLNTKMGQLANKKKQQDFLQYHMTGFSQAISKNGTYRIQANNQSQGSITGTIRYDVKEIVKNAGQKDKKGKVDTLNTFTRTAVVTVQFRVKDKKGKQHGPAKIVTNAKSMIRHKDLNAAKKGADTWSKLVKKAIQKSFNPSVQKMVPYFVSMRRTLLKGDSKDIKKANKMAAKGNWAAAVDIWKRFEHSGSRKDKEAIFYNQAIFDEIHGRLEGARQKYERVKQVSGNPKYNNEINSIKKRIRDEQLIQKANQSRQ